MNKYEEEQCPFHVQNINDLTCQAGCVCKKGTVRDQTTRKCVEPIQCGCSGRTQEWLECGNRCREPTCDNDKVGEKCPDDCERTCQCKTGYFRNDDGECVLLESCPTKRGFSSAIFSYSHFEILLVFSLPLPLSLLIYRHNDVVVTLS